METMTAAEPDRAIATGALLASFFTERELAGEIGVSLKTLHRWGAAGIGPARTKIGRKVLYSRRAVLEWLSACEHDGHDRRRQGRARAKSKSWS
jgi:Helix-turn-helix domain